MKNNKIFYALLTSIVLSCFISNSYAMFKSKHKEPPVETAREKAAREAKAAAITLGKEVAKDVAKQKARGIVGAVKGTFGRAALAVKEKLHVTTEGVMGNKVESLCESGIDTMIDGVVGVLNARKTFEKMGMDELEFRTMFRKFLEDEIPGRKNKIHDFLKELGAFN